MRPAIITQTEQLFRILLSLEKQIQNTIILHQTNVHMYLLKVYLMDIIVQNHHQNRHHQNRHHQKDPYNYYVKIKNLLHRGPKTVSELRLGPWGAKDKEARDALPWRNPEWRRVPFVRCGHRLLLRSAQLGQGAHCS